MVRLVGLVVGLAACGRGFEYEGGVADTDTGPVVTECGGDLDLDAGVNLSGTAIDLGTGATVTRDDPDATLCVRAVDPTPVVTSGGVSPPETLAASRLCEDGTYVLANLASSAAAVPAIGVMVEIHDCDGAESTVMRTVTGIRSTEFAGMVAGDTLEIGTTWSVDNTHLAALQEALEATGSTTDLKTAGYLAGFVLDADEQPVDGATVTCAQCQPTMYEDADDSEGLFTSGGTTNASTQAGSGAKFLIPGGPISQYQAEDGGTHTWDPRLYGSLPGYAVYIRFLALAS